MFTVQRTDQGWLALEFLAWAINNDYRRGGHQVLLSPIAPPPYLNEPGQSLQFVIEGNAGADAAALAVWLNRLRAECYIATAAINSTWPARMAHERGRGVSWPR